MNISISNLFSNNNPLGVSRTNADNSNPLSNLTQNTETMQNRIARIREQRVSDMQARIAQAQAENSLVPNEENGLTATLTQAIVSNDMALSRISETAATRATIESQIAAEGETPALQEALMRTEATLAAQIGDVLSSLQAQNNAISNAQNAQNAANSEEQTNALYPAAEDLPAATTATTEQPEVSSPERLQQAQVTAVYRNVPPPGLVVDLVR